MKRLDTQSLGDHVDRLYRAAWALCGSREDAEDLVQDTFARVLARPRMLHGDDELAYLMRVLRNTFLTGRRTASRRPQVAATLDELQAVDPKTGTRPDEAFAAGEVFAAIADLPESFRLALVAVDVLGLSYREAAKALGAREATITTRLYRARQQVARTLSPADTPAPGPLAAPVATDPAPTTGAEARGPAQSTPGRGGPAAEETGTQRSLA